VILTAIALILAGIVVVFVFSLLSQPAVPKPPPEVPVTGKPPVSVPPEPPSSPAATVTTTIVQGPPSFRLLVTPVEARARRGEAIQYTMTIEPKGGFDKPVSLRLDVRALFLYSESFDLGTVDPPYPKSVGYRFVVPANAPPGITVSGVLSGEGGGLRDTVSLVLIISG